METGGFFINPAHVAVIGQVDGKVFFVFPIGTEEGFMLRYDTQGDAIEARAQLVTAVTRAIRE